jgi:phosphatidylglycerophosphate synthase
MTDDFNDDIKKHQVKIKSKVKTWYGPNINRKISPYFTKLFLLTPLTPNHVTLLMILTGIAAAALFIPGNRTYAIIGACLLILQHTLDAVDGELARYKNMKSIRGKYLDVITHFITEPLLFIGIMFGLLQTKPTILILLAGIGAAYFLSVMYITFLARKHVILEKEMQKEKADVEAQYTKPSLLIKIYRHTLSPFFRWPEYHFVVLLAAIFNQLELFLYVYAIAYALLFLFRAITEYYAVPQ